MMFGVDPLARDMRRRVLAGIEADLARERAQAEALRAAVVPLVRAAVAEARARGACGRVWLFGSFAWGQPTESSDVDLLVEGSSNIDRFTVEIWERVQRPVHVIDAANAPATLLERVRGEGAPL